MHAMISSTFGNDKENTDIATQNLNAQHDRLSNSLQRTHTYQKTNLSHISIDYTKPLSTKGSVEVGYKGIVRSLNADFERANQINDEFIIDPLNTNIYIFHEQVHALYGQYTGWTRTKQEPKWKYNLGLRAEQVWNSGNIQTETERFRHKYFNLFPSGSIYYYTQKENNLKVSYSRRINRPGLSQLNPFTDITDSLNQRSGNPNLKPELVNSFELGYYHALEKVSFSLTTFYRKATNAILVYTTLDANGVASTQPLNFGNAKSYGAEAITTYSPFHWWSLNLSFSVYDLHIINESIVDISTRQVNWYSKVANTLDLFKNTKIQTTGSYTSPIIIPQGKSVAIFYVDMGLQQTIMKGKGRLGFTVTDIFDTQKYGFITSDDNFHFSRIFKLDTRAFMFTFGYTFGGSFRENLMENRFKNE
jgi:outer membrane receptor protein involved in Fe transport